MASYVVTGTEWNARAAALCGAVLGAAAVMAHELRDVLLRDCPAVDPFIHVMTEMAVAVPSGAMLFAGVATMRNRVCHSSRLVRETSKKSARRSWGALKLSDHQ